MSIYTIVKMTDMMMYGETAMSTLTTGATNSPRCPDMVVTKMETPDVSVMTMGSKKKNAT